jgi:hypothetical protein
VKIYIITSNEKGNERVWFYDYCKDEADNFLDNCVSRGYVTGIIKINIPNPLGFCTGSASMENFINSWLDSNFGIKKRQESPDIKLN